MINKDIQYFKYLGSKFKYLNTIRTVLSKTNGSIYIEPFLGSGSLFFNIDSFDKYIINDVDPLIKNITESIIDTGYSHIESFYNEMINRFGNFGKNKDSYYSFRAYVNALDENNLDKYIGLFYLIHSCMNSMVRFGPNGFNQSWGNRGGNIFWTPELIDKLTKKIDNTIWLLGDYSKLIDYDDEDAVWILDPPYNSSNYTYNMSFDSERFHNFIYELKGDIIYFDIDNNFGNDFFNNEIIVKEKMRKIRKGVNREMPMEKMWFKIK